jgi:hypothetical protein
MCIIIHKPEGETVSKDILKRCWDKNDDGAGFMWRSDNSIWGNKGYMSFKALLNGLEDAGFYDPEKKELTEKYALTIHFRLASHGTVKPANCHPFPVSDDYSLLKTRYWEADVGIAHNGIIPIKVGPGDVSDTMTWIKEIFSNPLVYGNMEDSAIKHLVASSINSSRLAIIYATGQVVLVGTWVKEDGVYYSNIGFRAPQVQPTFIPEVRLVKKGGISDFINQTNTAAGLADRKQLPPPGMKYVGGKK